VYCFCIFSNKLDLNQETLLYYKSKALKHYNYLQMIIKTETITKVIKMQGVKFGFRDQSGLIKSTSAFRGEYLD
jgi:hypothetical protein